MPSHSYLGHRIYFELDGPAGAPVMVFINGLTQATRHWAGYRDYFTGHGYRVLTYDLLGQGDSSKPVLGLGFDDNTDVLRELMDALEIDKAFVGGISFGGIIVLKFGIKYGERLHGIVPMSTFSQMDAQLYKIGTNLYQGMARVGFEYLVDLFTSYNFSDRWIAANADAIPGIKRASSSINDLYAIQNLMESITHFEGFTDELDRIRCPTLIMNGEFDALTPRRYHELLRQRIGNSRLLLMQHVFHAFTLEIPEITCRVLRDFMEQVLEGRWQGDQSVWIANDDPQGEPLMFPCPGDHTRAIPVAPVSAAAVKSIKTG